METKNTELASRVAKFVNRFPDEWQDYQDWLRTIVSSQSWLQERYPAGQATLIFRWRLVYFVVYVASGIFFGRLRRKFQQTVDSVATRTQYRYSLQRIATLLAVVEVTLCVSAA